MAMTKSMTLWVVNVVSFAVLLLLAMTGLINWLLLPHGSGRNSWVTEIRHLLMDIHAWLAVVFLLAIGIHIWLHGSYVKANLVRYRWFKTKGKSDHN